MATAALEIHTYQGAMEKGPATCVWPRSSSSIIANVPRVPLFVGDSVLLATVLCGHRGVGAVAVVTSREDDSAYCCTLSFPAKKSPMRSAEYDSSRALAAFWTRGEGEPPGIMVQLGPAEKA